MAIISEQNIGRVSFLFGVISVCVALCSVGFFFVVNGREADHDDLFLLEQTLIKQEKTRLEADVDSFLLRIWLLREKLLQSGNDAAAPAAPGGLERNESGDDDARSGPAPADEFNPQSVIAQLGNARDLDSAGFFIYDLHDPTGGEDFATMIFNPARPDLVGRRLSTDAPDARGFKFRKAFMQDIRDRGASCVIYHVNRDPGAGSEVPPVGRKLSCFKIDTSITPTGWIAAKSVPLDGVDQILVLRKIQLDKAHRTNLAVLAGTFLLSALVALFLAALFARGIRLLLAHQREAEAELRISNESLQKTLERESRTDPLTSTFNRGHLNQELVKEIARAGRYQVPLTMILFDVDDFKIINDSHGYEAGDGVLVELIELIRDNIRQTDLLARWEGEEFAILAPGIDLGQGMLFADKLRELVAEHRFSVDRQVTCSFGIGYYETSEDRHRFIKRIGEALAHAKGNGKNRCTAA